MPASVGIQERLEKANALFGEAKVILEDESTSVEDRGRVEGLITEAKALKREAANLAEIEKEAKVFIESTAKEEAAKEDEATPKREDNTKFKDWGEFLHSAWRANHKDGAFRAVDKRLQWFKDEGPPGIGDKAAPMVESVGASGGFLVPTEFKPTLLAALAEGGLVRPRSTIIPMRRRQIGIPVLDQTGTTAGVPHWFGGMKFYWTEEAAEKTATDASFRKILLTANKLIGYTYASDELLDDSAISLAAFLSGPLGFVGGIQWMEEYSFINGSGAGQPLGVINAGGTITVPRAATVAVGVADLLNMLEAFLPSGRGVWFYTQSALRELMEINGPTGNPSYIFMPSARDGVPATLFGMPAIATEKVPVLGTAGDFILADWRYYLIGDRQATTVESTQYDRWKYDETSWRVTHRVDGQPWLSAPLTYQDGATQVSPFVILGDKTT